MIPDVRQNGISRSVLMRRPALEPCSLRRCFARALPLELICIRRTEVASVHRDADQAARNLRRPGGDRHRERAAVPRTAEGIDWNSKRRRAKSWVSSPVRRRMFSRCWIRSRKNAARLCERDDAHDSTRATVNSYELVRHLTDRAIAKHWLHCASPDLSRRAFSTAETIHIHDIIRSDETEFPMTSA